MAFDGFTDLKRQTSWVAECDGLMMLRTDRGAETEDFVDLGTFMGEAERASVYSLNELSPDELQEAMRRASYADSPITKHEESQRYAYLEGAAAAGAGPPTYTAGEHLLVSQRLQDIERDREQSRAFIQRYLQAYPEGTVRQYQMGALDTTVARES